MGLQASAITQFGGVSVSTVVVTSTLARTADAALDHLWPAEAGKSPVVATPRLLLLTWLGYLVGAVAGGLLLHVGRLAAAGAGRPAGALFVLLVTPTSAA